MSVVRGRPPGLAGGISGASRAYCSSLRACPAPKSPTSARLSVVHMACLQEGLLPSRTGRRPACATRSPRRRRLLKRPLNAGGGTARWSAKVLTAFPAAIGLVVDASPHMLAVAHRNLASACLDTRCTVQRGDLDRLD